MSYWKEKKSQKVKSYSFRFIGSILLILGLFMFNFMAPTFAEESIPANPTIIFANAISGNKTAGDAYQMVSIPMERSEFNGPDGTEHFDFYQYLQEDGQIITVAVGIYPDDDPRVRKWIGTTEVSPNPLPLPDDGYRVTVQRIPTKEGYTDHVYAVMIPDAAQRGVYDATTQELIADVVARDAAGSYTIPVSASTTAPGIAFTFNTPRSAKVGTYTYDTDGNGTLNLDYGTLPTPAEDILHPTAENIAAIGKEIVVSVGQAGGPSKYLYMKTDFSDAFDLVSLNGLTFGGGAFAGETIKNVVSYGDIEVFKKYSTLAEDDPALGYTFDILATLTSDANDALARIFKAAVSSDLLTGYYLDGGITFKKNGGVSAQMDVPFSRNKGSGPGVNVIPEIPSGLIGVFGFLMGALLLWMRKKSAVSL